MLLDSVREHQVTYQCKEPPGYLIVLGATMLLSSVRGHQITYQC